MAVEKMKIISVIGPLDQFEDIVSNCVVDRDFHPENVMTAMPNTPGLLAFAFQNPYGEALKRMLQTLAFFGIAPGYFDGPQPEGGDPEALLAPFIETEDRLKSLLTEKEGLERVQTENRQILIQLKHIEHIDTHLEDLFTFNYVKFRFGRLPRDTYNAAVSLIDARRELYFFPTSIEKDFVYGMYMTTLSSVNQVDKLFISLHFERIRLSGKAHGTPLEAEQSLTGEIEAADRRLAEITGEIARLKEDAHDVLLAGYCRQRKLFDCYEIRKYAAHTADSFHLIGWAPKSKIAQFDKELSAYEDVVYSIDDPESNPSLTPPVRMKNLAIFRPFEMMVTTYGLPAYNEIDPTAFMAVTYSLLFGIMFGDVGQGILLTLGGFVIYLLKKMRLGRVVSCAGIFSTLFGFLYGSVFGNEHILPGFKTLESSDNINTALIATVAFGVILLTGSMVINVINGVRQRDPEKIFFSNKGLAGIVFYGSIVAIVLSIFFGGGAGFDSPVFVICAAAIVLTFLLMFFKEPLGHLLQRRADWMPEKKGDFLITTFFEMVEVLMSFATNTISFVRVGAFAINHAGLMMVVYMLAKTAGGSNNLIVLIIGNIFVIGLEGLVVGIQVLRLEFYEMFSKFFAGNGRPFVPFTINYQNDSTSER